MKTQIILFFFFLFFVCANKSYSQSNKNICDRINQGENIALGYLNVTFKEIYVVHFEDMPKRKVLNYPVGGEDSLFKYLFEQRAINSALPLRLKGLVSRDGFVISVEKIIYSDSQKPISSYEIFRGTSIENPNMRVNLSVSGTNIGTKYTCKFHDSITNEYLEITEYEYKSPFKNAGVNDMEIFSFLYRNEKLGISTSGTSASCIIE